MKKLYASLVLLGLISNYFSMSAQQITGDLQLNYGFYRLDSAILLGGPSTSVSRNLKSGGEGWMSLNYSKDDFAAGLRLDVYNNSLLINPQSPITKQGIGFWYVQKKIYGLTITAGYFYEQYGSGIVFRSYEDRGLGIDYAIQGIRLKYDLNDKWHIRAFTGQAKNFAAATTTAVYAPVMKGACLDGEVKVGHAQLLPGASLLNRTLDDASMSLITSNQLTFYPKYNVYAGSIFNTLNVGHFSWYAEGAYKSHEAILDVNNNLVDKDGNAEYTSLTFSQRGIGITVQAKRVENFVMRTSPNESLLNGVLDYLPPMSQQNSLRLPARYQPATQALGEQAYQADMYTTLSPKLKLNLNYSDARSLTNSLTWRECIGELEYKANKANILTFGYQYVFYDFAIYRSETGQPDVVAQTPFIAYVHKFNRKHSIHCDLQYQNTKQDYGSWLYAAAEYDIAPRWSFSVSDMYLIDPNTKKTDQKLHFYNIFIGYTEHATRYTFSYARQTDGINCSGGVCRYEPAFSGAKFQITTTF